MNKYIVWNNETNQLDPCWYPLVDGDKEISIIGMLDDNNHQQLVEDNACEIYKSTGKTDIHGDEIYYDFHVIKYKVRSGNCWKERIGIFHFNEDTLRAEIDIVNPKNVAPVYYEIGNMTDFEIIGNIKENPELIREGE